METGLWPGYLGTAKRKGRKQTNQTYGYRATLLLYRTPDHQGDRGGLPGFGQSGRRQGALSIRVWGGTVLSYKVTLQTFTPAQPLANYRWST